VGIGFAKEVLNNSITSKKQLQAMLSAPLIGMVDQTEAKGEKLYILGKGDRSAAAEQIRGIRANLQFYRKEGKTLFVLLTSSFSGEGKSFLSGNLAKSYALQNLRVALLEFDMRKPKLAKRMGVDAKQGLSTVLLGRDKPADILITDPETPNLHLYPTGAVPPNPSELMAMPGMAHLKEYLDTHYDVVIVDTPPLGLVADAQVMAHWADVSLVVVRFGVTPREQVMDVEGWYQQGILPGMGIILNGVKTTGYYGGYRYSPYYYKRKYGNQYYNQEEPKGKKPFWKKAGKSS
jgi:capsular exopolysaccharide synthesis family protein